MVDSKRQVPLVCQRLLSYDAAYSEKFVQWSNRNLPVHFLSKYYQMLEYSCHGIPWLAGWVAFILLFNYKSLYQMQVNFYMGLLLDLVIVGVIKAFVRRRRPLGNKPAPMEMGPDKYSFPSGHATRALYVAYFFIRLYPVYFIFISPICAWVVSICLSRVLMRRHHILDVACGVFIGILEGCIIGCLWLSQDTSASLLSWFTDERLDGGEYHV